MHSSTQFLIAIGSILLFAIAADVIGKHTFLPRVTLLLLFGVIIGKDVLDLIPPIVTNQFELLADIALIMVGFLIGGKLTRKSMQGTVGKTLWISNSAVLITVSIVSISLLLIGIETQLAILLGCIATATAPAATIDVISESNYQGPFASLLISIVAIDDALGLIVFSIGIAFVSALNGNEYSMYPVLIALKEIGGAIILGAGIGLPAAYLTGRLNPGQPILVEALALVFLCGGLAIWLNVSFLIASIVMGCVIVNLAKHHDYPFHAIEGIEWIFLIIFFTLAGASLSLESLVSIGLIGIVYIIARVIGKILGGFLGAKISKADKATQNWIGPALLPQAGVAVGMALVASTKFPQYQQLLLSVVISTTIFFEIVGPIVTRYALNRVQSHNNQFFENN
ncbi:MAG: cation:proton antiporter [Gammaproteobacteria bacterium]|nr:cation:proton antiporter [Gammaproteobacteria bacterium]MDH3609323.1 cation:proton antiporter [Gammaproteobacteria bacterium]NNC66930.1 cation:proton antiporter [Gammaproteobacteria bacterium]